MYEKFAQVTCNGCGEIDEQLWEGCATGLRKLLREEYNWCYTKKRDYCTKCVSLGIPKTGKDIFSAQRG